MVTRAVLEARTRGARPVTVTVLGSGDAFHSGGRRSSAYLVSTRRGDLLVDCGPTTPHALALGGRAGGGGRGRGFAIGRLRACLITHFHGDHFLGLPMLCLHKQVHDAGSPPLLVMGPRGVRSRLMRVYSSVYLPSARKLDGAQGSLIRFQELRPGDVARIGSLGATVTAVAAEHTREALSFRLTLARRTIAFTGDTAWSDGLIDLARGTDLCICECTTHDTSLPGHLAYTQIRRRSAELKTRRLILSHVGGEPSARAARYSIEVAHDGQVITL